MEQKNWTHVRQLLGYDRLEDPALREEINVLYRDIWEPFHNYFCPSAKLVSKDRHGAKIKRRHERPITPCDRLLLSPDVSPAAKKKLRQKRATLNPFELQRRLEAALRPVLQRALFQSSFGLPCTASSLQLLNHSNHGVMTFESTTPLSILPLGVRQQVALSLNRGTFRSPAAGSRRRKFYCRAQHRSV